MLPDATTALDYILNETINLIDRLLVYPEKMLEDLNMTGGLIYSPRVLLALVAKGAFRDTAYRWVQRNAMKRWLEGEDFYENLCKDEDVRKYLTPEEIKECFDYKPMLVHVDRIFAVSQYCRQCQLIRKPGSAVRNCLLCRGCGAR